MMGVVGASSPELLGEVEPMRLLLAFEHHAVQHVPVLVAGAEENEARVSEVEGAEFALVEHGQARGARALLAHHAVGDRERVEGARRAHVAFKALLRVLHQLSAVQACGPHIDDTIISLLPIPSRPLLRARQPHDCFLFSSPRLALVVKSKSQP
eukprot:2555458-Rhodomonas_salina.2